MENLKLWKCDHCSCFGIEDNVKECPCCNLSVKYYKMVEEKCHHCGSTKHLVYVSCCGKLACLNCVVDFGDTFICRECGEDFVTKEVMLVEVERQSCEGCFWTTCDRWVKTRDNGDSGETIQLFCHNFEQLVEPNHYCKEWSKGTTPAAPKQPSNFEKDLDTGLNLDEGVTAAKPDGWNTLKEAEHALLHPNGTTDECGNPVEQPVELLSCDKCIHYDARRITNTMGSCACVYGATGMRECISSGQSNFTPKQSSEVEQKQNIKNCSDCIFGIETENRWTCSKGQSVALDCKLHNAKHFIPKQTSEVEQHHENLSKILESFDEVYKQIEALEKQLNVLKNMVRTNIVCIAALEKRVVELERGQG